MNPPRTDVSTVAATYRRLYNDAALRAQLRAARTEHDQVSADVRAAEAAAATAVETGHDPAPHVEEAGRLRDRAYRIQERAQALHAALNLPLVPLVTFHGPHGRRADVWVDVESPKPHAFLVVCNFAPACGIASRFHVSGQAAARAVARLLAVDVDGTLTEAARVWALPASTIATAGNVPVIDAARAVAVEYEGGMAGFIESSATVTA